MILPADKGRATVILNTADYKTKCQDLLNDKRTYKQLKKDTTNSYRTKLINLLKELKNSGAITQEQYYKVYPTATEPPKFYGLPKVQRVDEDDSLISFDVSALFTSVPVEERLTLIYEKLAADKFSVYRKPTHTDQYL